MYMYMIVQHMTWTAEDGNFDLFSPHFWHFETVLIFRSSAKSGAAMAGPAATAPTPLLWTMLVIFSAIVLSQQVERLGVPPDQRLMIIVFVHEALGCIQTTITASNRERH